MTYISHSQSSKYRRTVHSCFFSYIIQAIVINFAPLLFLTFQDNYGISLSKITFLITLNFSIQLATDFFSSFFVDKIGLRTSMVMSHVLTGTGLILLGILPEIFSNPYTGLVISVTLYAIGGGLVEVLASPIVEACPTDNKERTMSLLHSFYCWGQAAVILVSTLYFQIFGINNWRYLAFIYGFLSYCNAFSFHNAPIAPIVEEGGQKIPKRELFKNTTFWILMIMIACASACEQTVSQWASTFAEAALSVAKTWGDLAGPMMFGLLMGVSRAFYAKFGDRIDLDKFMMLSTIICIISYAVIAFSPLAILNLIGCSICGLSVGIMWPGAFSKASSIMRNGGTAFFAYLALASDLGCTAGPTLAGFVSDAFDDNLKAGIAVAIIFPIILLITLFSVRNSARQNNP